MYDEDNEEPTLEEAVEEATRLTARLAEVEAERDTADGHIAECQAWLVKHGYEAGADGDLRPGMARIVDERDAALARAEKAEAEVAFYRAQAKLQNAIDKLGSKKC